MVLLKYKIEVRSKLWLLFLKGPKEYIETGNDELLVDVANLCMKEFAVGNHPKKHFNSVDDGEHV